MWLVPFFSLGFPLPPALFPAPVVTEPIPSLRSLAFSMRPLNLSDFDVGLPHILGRLSVARILHAVTHRRCNFQAVAGNRRKIVVRIKQGVSTISRSPESSCNQHFTGSSGVSSSCYNSRCSSLAIVPGYLFRLPLSLTHARMNNVSDWIRDNDACQRLSCPLGKCRRCPRWVLADNNVKSWIHWR